MTSGEQGMLVAKSDAFEGHQVYIFVSAAKTSETLKDGLDLWNLCLKCTSNESYVGQDEKDACDAVWP